MILEEEFNFNAKLKINNLTCLLGVILLFGFNAILFKSVISLIILINGILYHTFGNICLMRIDILSNLLLGIYVNFYTKFQPFTIIMSLMSLMIFIYNKSNIIHVFGIQLPLAFCLYLFELCYV